MRNHSGCAAVQFRQHFVGPLQRLQRQRALAQMEVGHRLAQQALPAQAGRRLAVHRQLCEAVQCSTQAALAQHQPGGIAARQ